MEQGPVPTSRNFILFERGQPDEQGPVPASGNILKGVNLWYRVPSRRAGKYLIGVTCGPGSRPDEREFSYFERGQPVEQGPIPAIGI